MRFERVHALFPRETKFLNASLIDDQSFTSKTINLVMQSIERIYIARIYIARKNIYVYIKFRFAINYILCVKLVVAREFFLISILKHLSYGRIESVSEWEQNISVLDEHFLIPSDTNLIV